MSDHLSLPEDTPSAPPPEAHLPLSGRQHQVIGASLSVPAQRFLLMLRGDQENATFQTFFRTYFGAHCPKVKETVRRDGLCVYWQGPDQLLLSFETEELLSAWQNKLRSQCPADLHISLIELSDYYCFIRLQGTQIFDVLGQGCPFNFRDLTVGQAVYTLYEKTAITLDYTAENTMDVMVRVSFAEYLWQHLVYANNQIHAFSA